ncbi:MULTISPECIES: hypothetical protein [Roseomonadaceae]|uniref:Uncharacterized protein n=1 Tax=Falsiroseomonas oleicola TaxID=2801474 RepID=A0ABS6HFS8_9PROT|nr:hypothetical protein [Roseomonas oleicola]MBU8546356.1 hypothetical protein [Roseomonas oleicola]
MSAPHRIAATNLRDLQWLLSVPVSRAMLVPAGVICLRHLLRWHAEDLCASVLGEPTSRRHAGELADLVRQLDNRLAPLEDVARLQADGVALPDREAWACGRAESARAALAAGLKLPDTRHFHGAQADAHGFPFFPSAPVLLTGGKRKPGGSEGGGAPLGAA